jgi:hypothetical protein
MNNVVSGTSIHIATGVLLAALIVSGAALAAKGGNGGGKGGHGGGGGGTAPAARIEGAGDSIMRGYNASCTRNTGLFDFLCYGGGDQGQNSFLDGSSTAVLSIVDRYLTIDPAATGGKSASQSGSEMTDPANNNFATQANAIVAAATTPVQVVVELGSNDLCNRNSAAEFYTDAQWQAAVDSGLQTLVNGLPNGSTVLLSSVPRVQDLRAAGIAKQTSDSRVDCEAFWTTFDVCPIATADDSNYGALALSQARYNEILAARAQAFNADAASTGVEVVAEYQGEFLSSVGTYRFSASEVNGGDCFHPSIEGQNKLSEMIWNNVFRNR